MTSSSNFFATARDDLTGPLDGVRILEVGRVWSAPQAAAILGDLGADVIRIELEYGRDGDVVPNFPGTDLSWFRETANRNKRSVHGDLRTPQGQDLVRDLARHAHVLVENFQPTTLEQWGLGFRDLHTINPALVYVSISGWGQYGQDIQRAAYDPAIQATSGWMALNGDSGGDPVRAQTFLADDLAALYAVIGALAALRHSERTGEGQHVDTAMLDTMIAGSSGLVALAAAGAPPHRWGNETAFIVPSNLYRTLDGQVYISIALNAHWRRLCDVMGRPDLARAQGFSRNEERLENRWAVDQLVAGWCATQTADAAESILSRAGIVAAKVRSMTEVAEDPHVRIREMLVEIPLHNGQVAPLPGVVPKFSRTPTKIRRPAPAAGADSDQVQQIDGRAAWPQIR